MAGGAGVAAADGAERGAAIRAQLIAADGGVAGIAPAQCGFTMARRDTQIARRCRHRHWCCAHRHPRTVSGTIHRPHRKGVGDAVAETCQQSADAIIIVKPEGRAAVAADVIPGDGVIVGIVPEQPELGVTGKRRKIAGRVGYRQRRCAHH